MTCFKLAPERILCELICAPLLGVLLYILLLVQYA